MSSNSSRQPAAYDNGPRHTIGFEPNTFIEIPAQRAKETLARYRGFTCGVPFAEALHSPLAVPTSILDS